MVTHKDVNATLLEQLRTRHLPAFREGFEETARKAVQETLSDEQYLLELTNRECDARRTRRIERMLRESCLPLDKTLSSFDLKRWPAKVARQMRTRVIQTWGCHEALAVRGWENLCQDWGVESNRNRTLRRSDGTVTGK